MRIKSKSHGSSDYLEKRGVQVCYYAIFNGIRRRRKREIAKKENVSFANVSERKGKEKKNSNSIEQKNMKLKRI